MLCYVPFDTTKRDKPRKIVKDKFMLLSLELIIQSYYS